MAIKNKTVSTSVFSRGLNSFQAMADLSFSDTPRLLPIFIGKEIYNAMS